MRLGGSSDLQWETLYENAGDDLGLDHRPGLVPSGWIIDSGFLSNSESTPGELVLAGPFYAPIASLSAEIYIDSSAVIGLGGYVSDHHTVELGNGGGVNTWSRVEIVTVGTIARYYVDGVPITELGKGSTAQGPIDHVIVSGWGFIRNITLRAMNVDGWPV